MNIIIEGCDGTGKSQVAKHIAETLGMYYWHESQPRTKDEYICMLMSGNIVFDRFCFGQFVYNTPEQRKMTMEELQSLVKSFKSYNTIVIYVDAHTEAIISRLIARGEGNEEIRDEMVKYIKNIRGTYRSVLRQAGVPYIEINGEGGAKYYEV